MTIPTQMSLNGFIATVPDLRFTSTGKARFYARVGCEHYRREVDGSLSKLEATFHDLVLFETAAERAYAQLLKGDTFIASGHVHEYAFERNGTTVVREQFVARHIGHDTARTTYEVHRRTTPTEPAAAPTAGSAAEPAAELEPRQVPQPAIGI